MNETENSFQDADQETPVSQQLADLRRQTNLCFIGACVISLCLAGFIGIQARRAGKDLEVLRPQMAQIQELNRKEAPVIETFVRQMVEYGKTHPEFAEKVLAKYGIKQAPSAAQPAATPKK